MLNQGGQICRITPYVAALSEPIFDTGQDLSLDLRPLLSTTSSSNTMNTNMDPSYKPRQSKQPIIFTALATLAGAFLFWAVFLRPASTPAAPVVTKVWNSLYLSGSVPAQSVECRLGRGGPQGRSWCKRHGDPRPERPQCEGHDHRRIAGP